MTGKWVLALALLGLVGAYPGRAPAQDCNVTFNVSHTQTGTAIGDVSHWTLSMGAGVINPPPGGTGGARIPVPAVEFDLDCFDGGNIRCVNDGTADRYQGDAFITTSNCLGADADGHLTVPVTFTSNAIPGGDTPNEIIFTASPEFVVTVGGPPCVLRFDTVTQGLSGDATPTFIQVAAGVGVIPGESDATCNTEPALQAFGGGTASILVQTCGDGLVNRTEETCDTQPPNTTPDVQAECPTCELATIDGNLCRAPGTPFQCTICGDDVLQEGAGETCDRDRFPTGAPSDHGPCRPSIDACTFCGDLAIQSTSGETCDRTTFPANAPAGHGACRPGTDAVGIACTFCGDGILQATATDPREQCDGPQFKPGSPPGRSCRPDCTFCGDGIVNDGEACDDGNANDTDDCTNTCSTTTTTTTTSTTSSTTTTTTTTTTLRTTTTTTTTTRTTTTTTSTVTTTTTSSTTTTTIGPLPPPCPPTPDRAAFLVKVKGWVGNGSVVMASFGADDVGGVLRLGEKAERRSAVSE